MPHAWKPYADPAKTDAERFMREPQRRCPHCGAIQTRQTSYAWGRVTGYLWRPLAGRCKPQAQDN